MAAPTQTRQPIMRKKTIMFAGPVKKVLLIKYPPPFSKNDLYDE
jgi:hypothetical protein